MGAPEIDGQSLDAETAERVIVALAPHVTPARLARLEEVLARRTRDVVLVLEDLFKAHNGAAMLRTAEAFGFLEVHVIESAPGSFKIRRTIAKGAHQWLDLRWHSDAAAAYAALSARGYAIWVADIGGRPVADAEIDALGKLALVFGNERGGPSAAALAAARGRFRVPMYGFVESFNVSVAAALSCYELTRRRETAGIARGLEPLDARRVLATWLAESVGTSGAILGRAGLPKPTASAASFEREE